MASRVMLAGRPGVDRYERRHHKDRCEDESEFRGHVFPPSGARCHGAFVNESRKESCDASHILFEGFINFIYWYDKSFFSLPVIADGDRPLGAMQQKLLYLLI
jgi:hypothetical protein